jgi:hypothetical protein
VLGELDLDATAEAGSIAAIVKASVRPKAWHAAGAAPSTSERAAILLHAIRAIRVTDENDNHAARAA